MKKKVKDNLKLTRNDPSFNTELTTPPQQSWEFASSR